MDTMCEMLTKGLALECSANVSSCSWCYVIPSWEAPCSVPTLDTVLFFMPMCVAVSVTMLLTLKSVQTLIVYCKQLVGPLCASVSSSVK